MSATAFTTVIAERFGLSWNFDAPLNVWEYRLRRHNDKATTLWEMKYDECEDGCDSGKCDHTDFCKVVKRHLLVDKQLAYDTQRKHVNSFLVDTKDFNEIPIPVNWLEEMESRLEGVNHSLKDVKKLEEELLVDKQLAYDTQRKHVNSFLVDTKDFNEIPIPVNWLEEMESRLEGVNHSLKDVKKLEEEQWKREGEDYNWLKDVVNRLVNKKLEEEQRKREIVNGVKGENKNLLKEMLKDLQR